jgi:hypothetical protein
MAVPARTTASMQPLGVVQPVTRRSPWRRAAVALSFANLCYLRVWSELLTWSGHDAYVMKRPYSRADYGAAILNVLLVGALAWAVSTGAGRLRSPRLRRLARWGFFVALLLPLEAVRAVLAKRFTYLRSPLLELVGAHGTLLLGAGLGAAALLVIWRWPRQLARASATALLLVSPLAPVTFAQAIWRAARYDDSAFRDGALAPLLREARTSPRIVWVILDEWDQRLTFADRPESIRLPEIDRLRRESLHAENAYSPGSETSTVMPALITGRLVAGAIRRGPSELLLVYPEGQPPVPWAGEPNIFSAARQAGFNTALVGWYYPYCRTLASTLSDCAWWPMSMPYNSMGRTLPELVPNQTRSLLETSLFSVFGQSLSALDHARTYHEMMARARGVIADRRYGLTLLHLPIPHSPHVFNRRTGRFDLKNSPIRGYIDSLVLADGTIGELRRTLEEAGLWEDTTVLFTSDHAHRSAAALDGKKDHRVPFLLKMAGQPAPVRFIDPFNTVLTHDLLLAILGGQVSTSEQAAAWLSAHRTIADSPYSRY